MRSAWATASSRTSGPTRESPRGAHGDQRYAPVETYFTRANFQQPYLRDDPERDVDLDEFVGHEWRGYEDTQNAYRSTELGPCQFTVRVFENGYLLRIASERHGVLITTDGLTMREYEEVATAIEHLLAEERAGE